MSKKKDNYLEKGEKEASKCRSYESNCYCDSGSICHVFMDKIMKAKDCPGFEEKENPPHEA